MGPGSDATGSDTTQGATSLVPTLDGTADTTDETATETGDPPGCVEPVVPGEVCHDDDTLPLPEGCVPYPVLIADLNDDGRGDVIVACESGPLVFYPGMGSGHGPMVEIDPQSGTAPRDLAVADLDNDGSLDVVVLNEFAEGGVRVYYRTQAGVTLTTYGVGGSVPSRVAAGRWFGGELDPPDLFVTLTMEVRPLPNDNMFVPGAGHVVLPVARDLAVGSLNGDGLLDVAVASDGAMGMDGEITLLMNGGMGVVQTEIHTQTGKKPNAVVVDDINGDFIDDVAFTYGGKEPGVGFLYRSQGTFVEASHAIGMFPNGLAVGDFDANTDPDVVIADGAGHLLFLMTDGAGGSWIEDSFDLESEPFAVAAGYIDADDHADVVVSLPTAGEVVILQSSP